MVNPEGGKFTRACELTRSTRELTLSSCFRGEPLFVLIPPFPRRHKPSYTSAESECMVEKKIRRVPFIAHQSLPSEDNCISRDIFKKNCLLFIS